jgi:protein subunit release factor A
MAEFMHVGSNPTRLSWRMEMNILVEIRAAEGGDDSKLLVLDQVSIYKKLCARERL